MNISTSLLSKAPSRKHLSETITDADFADNISLRQEQNRMLWHYYIESRKQQVQLDCTLTHPRSNTSVTTGKRSQNQSTKQQTNKISFRMEKPRQQYSIN